MSSNHTNSEGHCAEDLQVWREICKGQRSALDRLFRMHYNGLFDYGMRIRRDEELVKDAIQNLFLTIWEHRTSISVPQSVKAYMLVSFRREMISLINKRTNQKERQRTYMDEFFDEELTTEQLILKAENDREVKASLVAILNQLNSRQKETLFLRYYHGLSNEEIAQVMDINYQSVKNNLSRALQNLRVLFKSTPEITLLYLLESLPEWLM